jgi:hypothetical protein
VVAVEVRSPVFNEETGQVEWCARALVRADGGELAVYGPEGAAAVVDLAMNVVDVTTGEVVYSSDAPERWARFLPFSLRAGDLIGVVVHDDDPVDVDAGGLAAEDAPEIPAPSSQLHGVH